MKHIARLVRPFTKVHRSGQRLVEHNGLWILGSMLGTVSIMRFMTKYIVPHTVVIRVEGHHLHHAIIGALMMAMAFLWRDCSRHVHHSIILQRWVRILFGSGLGLFLDEFQVVLLLDGSPLAHSYYYGIVIGAFGLLCFIWVDLFLVVKPMPQSQNKTRT